MVDPRNGLVFHAVMNWKHRQDKTFTTLSSEVASERNPLPLVITLSWLCG